MIRTFRLRMTIASMLACAALITNTASADTWSDNTGQFKIEAEFVGVKGSSIVLKKTDGSTIEVPINRLSLESRGRAKQLYEMSKGGGEPAGPTTAPPMATPPSKGNALPTPSSTPASLDRDSNSTPPSAASTQSMPMFPDNPSLQETFDFCRDQILDGHPEVLWYALPSEMRAKMDSQEFRTAILPSIQQQAQTNKAIEGIFKKVFEVLTKKKQFVLNSPPMAQVPPPFMPMVQQAYDPAVGIVYEITNLAFDAPNLETKTITQMMDSHGPKIGGHLKSLVTLLPPGMIDQFTASMKIAQTDDDNGTIVAPNDEGGTETTEMVRYQGRWIPKQMAEEWESNKDNLIAEMQAELQNAQQGEAAAQANMMVGMAVTMAGGILDPMLAANTQQEFDQALLQVMNMANMFGGGGGAGGGFPGGPGGAGGGFPGGPGGAGGGFPGGPGGAGGGFPGGPGGAGGGFPGGPGGAGGGFPGGPGGAGQPNP